MPTTANADRCEIVCTPVEVANIKGKDKLIVERNGRFSIQEGPVEQEIKLSNGKLTKNFKNAENYAKTIEKQKAYKQRDKEDTETER